MQSLTKLQKRLLVAVLLLISLSVGVGTYMFTQLKSPSSFLMSPEVSTVPEATPATKLPPTAIRIAKLNLQIPVQAALVHDNEWDMFDKSVSWLSTSAVPGEGNVILYAHNRKALFGDIYKLKAGDTVEVMQHDKWLTYTVTESRQVTDKDVDSILSPNNQLTLYTCEGSFDQKRRVVYASPL